MIDFGVLAIIVPMVVPADRVAGSRVSSVTTSVFVPPGQATGFRVCIDTVLGGAVSETTKDFSDWTDEIVTTGGGVVQVAIRASLGVC